MRYSKYKGKLYSITFLSKKLLLTKWIYDIYNKELLAIVTLLNIQKMYTEEALELNIYIDYKNLLYFITTK